MSTPVRRQYLQLKSQYPEAILFFRMGDFYEAFDEDAELIAAELNLVLTAREAGKGNKVPMAGVPHHAAENYIARLIKNGHKVAVCEQIGTESINGLMPRDVVRVVTPGTLVEPSLLEAKQNNYLAAIVLAAEHAGLAYIDISTGNFAATSLQGQDPTRLVLDELNRLNPAEVILPDDQDQSPFRPLYHLTPLAFWQFEEAKAAQTLRDHFQVNTLDGLGLRGQGAAIRAAGAILQYLADTHKNTLPQITSLSYYSTANFMVLDANTRRNLELTETIRGQHTQGSLIAVLDETITPMGGRLLRTWLQQPLLNLPKLNRRLDAVEACYNSTTLRAELRQHLKGISDVERLTTRLLQNIAQPKNLLDLRHSLERIPALQSTLRQHTDPTFAALAEDLHPCPQVVTLLQQALADDPPAQLAKGNVIRPGFSAELDNILTGASAAREWIANLEQSERQRTGINALKVGFNKVFGYYLEVTKANTAHVPNDYIRKQTLVNAERYITPELKEYESLLLNAEERQLEVESRIFAEVVAQVAAWHKDLYQTARTLARLDAYQSLGQVAAQNNYVRPTLTQGDAINIIDGRHPVVEQSVLNTTRNAFVPNDTQLSNEALIAIITGPNMAGKSTYLRQVALIVLMAQLGSFVPARQATIGLVDRIFTRLGAQDEIHAGQSTFMVEMVETAALLSQATPQSLLILDEIGRGTSTYDGLSIARAIIEYLHNNPNLRAKTLFATHYHELVEMEKYLPHVCNYNVAATEQGQDIVFLHKVLPGPADRSYGVHVAKLAGLPKPVINRANEILGDLENNTIFQQQKAHLRQAFSGQQLSFFATEPHPALKTLRQLKVEELSPLEALNTLFELQKQAAAE